MILLALIFSTCVLTISADKLHEHMTKEEIEAVFNVKHDEVHKIEYEVVPIYHMDNDQTNVKLRAFNQDYDLYLENNNHILLGDNTPVYIAKGNQERALNGAAITYSRIPYPFPNEIKLYQDMKNRAALAVHKDTNNKAHLDGIIGDDIIIRHVPPRIHNEVLKNYPHLANPSENFGYDLTNHVIMKPHINNHSFNNTNDAGKLFDKKKNQSANAIQRSEQQTYIPLQYPQNQPQISNNNDIFYLEILITVDYDTFKIHGSNIESVAKYMAAFWNAVDLRYREISNPNIRLNIAGLIIPQEINGAIYFELNRATPEVLLVQDTAKSIGQYFVKSDEFPKNTYDIVVGITQRDLGVILNGKLISTVRGFAGFRGACAVYNDYSVVLIEDKGGFNGIASAAHELAHTMGAPHDGPESINVPGGPCPSSDGYLMSYDRKNSNGVHWSQCSITAMKIFLRSTKAQCLKNKPNPGKPYPKILPGKLLTRDEQCQRSMGKKADQNASTDCAILWCDGETNNRPPAEGTSCGHEMICLDAVCVRDPELSN